MSDFLNRMLGNKPRIPIRPALISNLNAVQIVESTYIDANADSDHSADDPIYAGNSYSGNPLRWIILKLAQSITTKGVVLLAVEFRSTCGVSLLTSASGPEISVYQTNTVKAITNWGGLTISSVRWSNRGTLTLSSALAAPATSHAYLSQGIDPTYLQYLYSGAVNSGATELPLTQGGIVLNAGVSTITFDALVIQSDVNWSNVYIDPSGDIVGTLAMAKPNTTLPMTAGVIYKAA